MFGHAHYIGDAMKQHINALSKLFPDSTVQCASEYDGRSGIWTSFGEDGTSNYERAGWPEEHDPKLQAYMAKHGLWAEWEDPGTLFIYKA